MTEGFTQLTPELWASWQAGLETVHWPLTVERVERDVEDEPARRAARR